MPPKILASTSTADRRATPLNTQHGTEVPNSPAQSNSGGTINVSTTGAQGPRLHCSEDALQVADMLPSSEGRRGHVDELPTAPDLGATKQREIEHNAMKQANVDPLAQSYRNDGTLAKGLEHVLSKPEPVEGAGLNAHLARKSVRFRDEMPGTPKPLEDIKIISTEDLYETDKSGIHLPNRPAPDVAPSLSGIPPQGVQQNNESAMTNDNMGGQTQTGGVTQGLLSTVQGSFNVLVPAGEWMWLATSSGWRSFSAYAAPVIDKGVSSFSVQ